MTFTQQQHEELIETYTASTQMGVYLRRFYPDPRSGNFSGGDQQRMAQFIATNQELARQPEDMRPLTYFPEGDGYSVKGAGGVVVASYQPQPQPSTMTMETTGIMTEHGGMSIDPALIRPEMVMSIAPDDIKRNNVFTMAKTRAEQYPLYTDTQLFKIEKQRQDPAYRLAFSAEKIVTTEAFGVAMNVGVAYAKKGKKAAARELQRTRREWSSQQLMDLTKIGLSEGGKNEVFWDKTAKLAPIALFSAIGLGLGALPSQAAKGVSLIASTGVTVLGFKGMSASYSRLGTGKPHSFGTSVAAAGVGMIGMAASIDSMLPKKSTQIISKDVKVQYKDKGRTIYGKEVTKGGDMLESARSRRLIVGKPSDDMADAILEHTQGIGWSERKIIVREGSSPIPPKADLKFKAMYADDMGVSLGVGGADFNYKDYISLPKDFLLSSRTGSVGSSLPYKKVTSVGFKMDKQAFSMIKPADITKTPLSKTFPQYNVKPPDYFSFKIDPSFSGGLALKSSSGSALKLILAPLATEVVTKTAVITGFTKNILTTYTKPVSNLFMPFTASKSKTKQDTSFKLKKGKMLDLKPLSSTMTASRQRIKQDSRIDVISFQSSYQAQRLRQDTLQRQDNLQLPAFDIGIGIGGGKDTILPDKDPIGGGGIILPSFGETSFFSKKKKKKLKRAKTKQKYLPSLSGIFSKKTLKKAPKGRFTGLEIKRLRVVSKKKKRGLRL